MTKRSIILGFLLFLLIFPFACKTEIQMKGIDLKITFSEDELSENLLTNMEYNWKTNDKFEKINQDMSVYVHIFHGDRLLIQDDHFPEVSISQWEPERKYAYKREIYIPFFIDEFVPTFKKYADLRLSVGLYLPDERTESSKRALVDKNLKVFPQPEDIPEIIYENGWYNLEIDLTNKLKQWRWTEKISRCIIENPHKDALLIIKGSVNLEAVDKQKVLFKINNSILDEFYPEESNFYKSYKILKEMLGEGDEFYLSIETDKTFFPIDIYPDSTDHRELGLAISLIYFR